MHARTRLEPVFLANVALFLCAEPDFVSFAFVSHKTTTALAMLRTNPNFLPRRRMSYALPLSMSQLLRFFPLLNTLRINTNPMLQLVHVLPKQITRVVVDHLVLTPNDDHSPCHDRSTVMSPGVCERLVECTFSVGRFIYSALDLRSLVALEKLTLTITDKVSGFLFPPSLQKLVVHLKTKQALPVLLNLAVKQIKHIVITFDQQSYKACREKTVEMNIRVVATTKEDENSPFAVWSTPSTVFPIDLSTPPAPQQQAAASCLPSAVLPERSTAAADVSPPVKTETTNSTTPTEPKELRLSYWSLHNTREYALPSSLTALTGDVPNNVTFTTMPTALKRLNLEGSDPDGSMLWLASLTTLTALTFTTRNRYCELDLSSSTALRKLSTLVYSVVFPTSLTALTTAVYGGESFESLSGLRRLSIAIRNAHASVRFPSRLDDLSLNYLPRESNLKDVVVDTLHVELRLPKRLLPALPRSVKALDATFVGVSRALLEESFPSTDLSYNRLVWCD